MSAELLFGFIDSLSNLAKKLNLNEIYQKLNFINIYIYAYTDKSIQSLGNFLKKNQQKIINRDDSCFRLEVEGDLADFLNQIGTLWEQLSDENRKVMWEWMDQFLLKMNI